jgi:ankyrin repeat protein
MNWTKHGNIDIITRLLDEFNVHINTIGKKKRTALGLALSGKNSEVVDYLLKRGRGNVSEDDYGISNGISNGHLPILLKYHILIPEQSTLEKNIIRGLYENSRRKIYSDELLVTFYEQNREIILNNPNYLRYIIEYGIKPLIQILLEKEHVNIREYIDNNTPIKHAMYYPELLQYYVEQGFDIYEPFEE